MLRLRTRWSTRSRSTPVQNVLFFSGALVSWYVMPGRRLDAQVAVVVVDGDGARCVDLLGQREEHGLVLLVVDQVGLVVVVAQRDTGDDGRLEASAAWVAADRRQPRRGDVGPADGDAGGDLLHQRRLVGGEVASGGSG